MSALLAQLFTFCFVLVCGEFFHHFESCPSVLEHCLPLLLMGPGLMLFFKISQNHSITPVSLSAHAVLPRMGVF